MLDVGRPRAGPIKFRFNKFNSARNARYRVKSDSPSGFLLPDRGAIRSIPAGCDILDPHGDDITAAKLAVDRQLKHGEVASAAFDL
ncbi:MAG: hypothetical protein QOI87_981 [Bradyrhizobium sp.]|jgi:hypothetical protein|nr:hypothetical protein [Bradyrhizobium sp.]